MRFDSLLMSGATFSPCRRYRYELRRGWDRKKPKIVFIGLNPSTANETANDPTVRRCMGFARDWDGGGLVMLNIFAFRATLPADLRKAEEPIGDDNDQFILDACRRRTVIAAWGTHGTYRSRCYELEAMLRHEGVKLQCLGTTKAGHPKHPLYLRADTAPVPFSYEGRGL